jgi:hypothetical protein
VGTPRKGKGAQEGEDLCAPLRAALIELAMEFRSMAEHLERRAQRDQEG